MKSGCPARRHDRVGMRMEVANLGGRFRHSKVATLGASMPDALNGSGALDDEVSPAFPFFAQGVSRSLPGPVGGSVQVVHRGG